MQYQYSLEWLTNKFDTGERLKFLFFWGHSNPSTHEIGKFCLSQWFELPFIVDDVTYKTAEHWMMAGKALLFNDLNNYQKIINAKTPAEAKELGKGVPHFDEQVWHASRYDMVVLGNIHKFNQHPRFADYLINTNDRILVEASPVDKVWGIGLSKDDEHVENPYFWDGQNLLGFALMEARDFLKTFGRFDYIASQVPLPWKAYPKLDSTDMFWRMGKGEEVISNFASYYNSLPEKSQTIFRLSNPPPIGWVDFYD